MNRLGRAKASATRRWTDLQTRRPSVAHVAAAWTRLKDRNGNLYAGAITYFSFLALFPLILLAVAITGFVLHAHPAAQADLFDRISENVPGDFGKTLHSSIKTAIDARTSVGVIGLAGVLVVGLGWIGNLRAAIEAIWDRPKVRPNFFKAKLNDALVLVGLGFAVLVSLALTVVGTSLTGQILRALDLNDAGALHIVVKIVGIAVALLGDVLIFSWLLVRLPGVVVPRRSVLRGSLLAAVGFEVLKIVGTFTIAHTANSPTAGPFASIIAILIWIQLVARYVLFCVAWTATDVEFSALRRRELEAQSDEGEREGAPDAGDDGRSVDQVRPDGGGEHAVAGEYDERHGHEDGAEPEHQRE